MGVHILRRLAYVDRDELKERNRLIEVWASWCKLGNGFVCCGIHDPKFPGISTLPPPGVGVDENTPLAATVAA